MALHRPQLVDFHTKAGYRRAVSHALGLALAEARHAWDYGTREGWEAAALVAQDLQAEIEWREAIASRYGVQERVTKFDASFEQFRRRRFPSGFEMVSSWPLFGEKLPERWTPKAVW